MSKIEFEYKGNAYSIGKCHCQVGKANYGNNLEVVFIDATNTVCDVRWYAATEMTEFYNAIRQWVRDGIL